MLPAIKSLPGLCCAGLMMTSLAQAEELVTSFEAAEGFVAGEIAAEHAEWKGTSRAAAPDLAVTGEDAYQGTQSLSASNAKGSYTFAQSPNLYSAGFSEVSFYLKNPTAEFLEPDQVIARWEVIYADNADETGNRIVLHLRYSSANTFHVHAGSSSEAISETGNRNVLPGSKLKLGEWNQVGLHFDFNEKKLTITINGVKLSRTLALNPEKVTSATRVSGVRFGTPVSVGNGITFYDFVQGFPAKN